MAARNHQVLKQTIRLFSSHNKVEGLSGCGGQQLTGDDLDESDVWSCTQPAESKLDSYSTCKTNIISNDGSSLPVKIPDWSKIYTSRSSGKSSSYYDHDDVESDDMEAVMVPPHEVVMRRRGASLSVVEGAGRTLKGRDLSRVRNAIWAKTGFQD